MNRIAPDQRNATTSTAPAITQVILPNDNLGQSQPNPVTHAATIRYNIPAAAKNAQLTVTDNTGRTIKQISLHAGTGVVNMDATFPLEIILISNF